jgi:hypothetical protein
MKMKLEKERLILMEEKQAQMISKEEMMCKK